MAVRLKPNRSPNFCTTFVKWQIFVMKADSNCQKIYSFLLLFDSEVLLLPRFCYCPNSVQFIYYDTSWENIHICKNLILSSFCFKLSMCIRFLWSGSLHSTFLKSAESSSQRLDVLHCLLCLLLCSKFLSLPPLTWDAFCKHYYFSRIHFLRKLCWCTAF